MSASTLLRICPFDLAGSWVSLSVVEVRSGGKGGVFRFSLPSAGGRAANLFRDNEGGQSRKLTSRASSLASGSCIQSTRQAKLRVPHPTYPTNHNHPISIPPTHKCLPHQFFFRFFLFFFLSILYQRSLIVGGYWLTSSTELPPLSCAPREKKYYTGSVYGCR